MHGILNRLQPTRELNEVSETDWPAYKIKFKDASKQQISLHYAAAQESTLIRIAVSCACKAKCSLRYRCIKNKLKCSQYCHGDRRGCGNMGTILEATKKSIIDRNQLVGRPDQGALTIILPKRPRKNTVTMPKKLPKRRKTASKEPGQITLSQFENMAPVIKQLETLEGQSEGSGTINKK